MSRCWVKESDCYDECAANLGQNGSATNCRVLQDLSCIADYYTMMRSG